MGGRAGGRAQRVRGGQLEGRQPPEPGVGERDRDDAGRRGWRKIGGTAALLNFSTVMF